MLHQLSQTSPARHTVAEHRAVIGKTIDRPDLLETVIEHGIAGVRAIRGIATVTAMSGEWQGRGVHKRVERVFVCVELCHQQVAASLEKWGAESCLYIEGSLHDKQSVKARHILVKSQRLDACIKMRMTTSTRHYLLHINYNYYHCEPSTYA